ncbi:COX15/CtaA family protein [Variovorax sp. NFACC27]|uniref:COX15/CtaA family protein n=1 Tax=unclassified Variovorax TaxID=663243 RepID=UPI00089BAAAD|nr:cytochrome c oxidase assembly protein subunit 15 [Variovorax paradoxus]SEF29100.1 cytochrome c oxidase assembly protein subunit 15 [Variovorax sp. NFACC28]SEG92413.1 cytochrome c oxidase assembly protein subunit 15 [Variovorax sp. NFACC29]SFD64679.1 cytochrome c oxidase assembly protein subunit 15 [Variovorax sp. NFACC26]SFG98612.1 cytochrome c oxidase assembly protein subunit 15 [Variovorax sp. NFACC27]
MDTTSSLYDLTPIAWLMAVGVLIALGPLVWVWRRNAGSGPARRLHALTVLTLFLTFDLTLFGAFTRLTDSGLGCPDWPGCYGNASPHGARHEIAMAQSAQPTGPVTHSKAWVEMVHRYLATGVGVLILTLAGATWIVRRRQRRAPPAEGEHHATLSAWWPAFTLFWVCLQGAFGMLTVTWKLFPAIVTLHLLGAVVLLALLCIQAVHYRQAAAQRLPTPVSPALRNGLIATTALLVLQIALGGWVSTNYAVLACTQFPTCQDSWWPPMNFVQGFEIWRHLGVTGEGQPLDFSALTAIHYAHRLMAYAVFVALGVLAWRMRRIEALRPQARWLAGLALLQLATGLGNVLLGWPLAAAVLHTGGAAALAVVLTWALCESRRVPAAQIARASDNAAGQNNNSQRNQRKAAA